MWTNYDAPWGISGATTFLESDRMLTQVQRDAWGKRTENKLHFYFTFRIAWSEMSFSRNSTRRRGFCSIVMEQQKISVQYSYHWQQHVQLENLAILRVTMI